MGRVFVLNETCIFSGPHPVLNWTLRDASVAPWPSAAFLRIIDRLLRLGAEVSAPQRCERRWSVSVCVRARSGSTRALAVGHALARLDPDAYNGKKLRLRQRSSPSPRSCWRSSSASETR